MGACLLGVVPGRSAGSLTTSRRWLVIPAVVILVAAVVVVVIVTHTGSSSHRSGVTAPLSAGADMTTETAQPAGSTNVTAAPYDADNTGATDAAAAIQAAITATPAGGVVYIPAGIYDLDNPVAVYAFKLTQPVTVEGAGAGFTTLVQEQGAAAPTSRSQGQVIFQVNASPTTPTIPGGGADGTVIEGMTLNSQAFDGGTTVIDEANNTTLDDLNVLGPQSDPSYNSDQFGVRTIVACNNTNQQTVYRSGNVVENLTLNGRGKAGNTDLDVSCENNEKVSNLLDTGNGVDVYQAGSKTLGGVTISGYTYHPGTYETTPQSIILTGPEYDVAISDFVTYGTGGKFTAIAPNSGTIYNTVITDEQVIGSGVLTIDDIQGLSVHSSSLAGVAFNPVNSTNDAYFAPATTVGGPVTCGGAGWVYAPGNIVLPTPCN